MGNSALQPIQGTRHRQKQNCTESCSISGIRKYRNKIIGITVMSYMKQSLAPAIMDKIVSASIKTNQTTCVTSSHSFNSTSGSSTPTTPSSSWFSSISSSGYSTPDGSSSSPFFSSFTRTNSSSSENSSIRDYNVWMPQ